MEITKTIPTGKVEIPWSDEWQVFTCDKCGVPIIIAAYGDPRSYLYPPPDLFADTLPEMDILCHDCYVSALSEDQAARNGCSRCGEPVQQEAKFYGETGVLCDECIEAMLEGRS
jgi:hypothetical protein